MPPICVANFDRSLFSSFRALWADRSHTFFATLLCRMRRAVKSEAVADVRLIIILNSAQTMCLQGIHSHFTSIQSTRGSVSPSSSLLSLSLLPFSLAVISEQTKICTHAAHISLEHHISDCGVLLTPSFISTTWSWRASPKMPISQILFDFLYDYVGAESAHRARQPHHHHRCRRVKIIKCTRSSVTLSRRSRVWIMRVYSAELQWEK